MLTLLLALTTAHAADTLGCSVTREQATFQVDGPIVEGQASLSTPADSPLAFRLDASMGPTTFFLVLQDDKLQKRVSFTASANSVSERASLTSGKNNISCRQQVSAQAEMPQLPAEKDYLVCILDEAQFKNGSVESTKRRFTKVFSPLQRNMPISIKQQEEDLSFSLKLVAFDPFHGLDAEIVDKASGENAHFVGPARALNSSFMLGLTLGDRDKEAKFLRLGCIWTEDFKGFLQ